MARSEWRYVSAVSTRWPPFVARPTTCSTRNPSPKCRSSGPDLQNKRLRAVLTRQVDDQEVNAKDVVFDWLAQEVQQRDPQKQRTVVAIMDGETKLRDLQELKIGPGDRMDIWHVTEYLWKLAHCFHPGRESPRQKALVETY